MKRTLIFVALFAAAVISAATSTAQDRWSLELQAGPSFAIGNFGSASLGTGVGIEGAVMYRVTGSLQAYAGWGWNHFAADPAPGGSTLDYEETGYAAGVQIVNPIGSSALSYTLGAGAVLKHVEVENGSGDRVADTRHGFGWEVNAGVQIPLSASLTLAPGVRYRSLARDITVAGSSSSATLNTVLVGAGLIWSL